MFVVLVVLLLVVVLLFGTLEGLPFVEVLVVPTGPQLARRTRSPISLLKFLVLCRGETRGRQD